MEVLPWQKVEPSRWAGRGIPWEAVVESLRPAPDTSQTPTSEQCEEAATAALEAFRDIMEAEGIGGRYLAQELKKKTNATRTEPFKAKVLKKGPDGQILETEEIIYSKPLEDNATSLKALDMVFKLRGDYPSESIKINHAGTLDVMVRDAREKLLNKINAIADRATAVRGDTEPDPG